MKGKHRHLNTTSCPVIKVGILVEVLHVFDFPRSNTQFVTVQDLENIPLDRYGKPEPIISTFQLTSETFCEELSNS